MLLDGSKNHLAGAYRVRRCESTKETWAEVKDRFLNIQSTAIVNPLDVRCGERSPGAREKWLVRAKPALQSEKPGPPVWTWISNTGRKTNRQNQWD